MGEFSLFHVCFCSESFQSFLSLFDDAPLLPPSPSPSTLLSRQHPHLACPAPRCCHSRPSSDSAFPAPALMVPKPTPLSKLSLINPRIQPSRSFRATRLRPSLPSGGPPQGFGLDAYVVIGTLPAGQAHTWVLTLERRVRPSSSPMKNPSKMVCWSLRTKSASFSTWVLTLERRVRVSSSSMRGKSPPR